MIITIRRFTREDIDQKVEWINNPENNKYLHYDFPLEISKTKEWFDRNEGRIDRFDAIIEVDGIACGLIGLLHIDKKNEKAEYYITMCNPSLKKKGIASQATKLILNYSFSELGLNRVYLFTEVENIPAQRLFESVGFVREGCLHEDIVSHNSFADRYVYGICKNDFQKER